MLKNKNFALGTAALLLSTAGFTACSSEDTFTGSSFTGEAVKTQFAINIPVAKSVNGRLAGDIVQAEGADQFRGMSNIKLVPFSTTNLEGNPNLPANAIVLGDITNADGATPLTNGAKFYKDVAVPVGTQDFLFYSEATRGSDATDKTNGAIVAPTEFDNGDLAHVGTLNSLTFNLKPIAESANTEIQTYLAKALTNINNVLVANSTTDQTLATAANNFKGLTVGSSQAILAAVQSLYDMVKDGGSNPNTDISAEIKKYFTDGSGKLSYTTGESVPDDVDKYPACLNIPAGAAQVAYNNEKSEFAYTSENSSDFASYVYPAALYYFANSTVKTSETPNKGDSWSGSTTENWETFVGGYDNTVVTSTTQSIALAAPVEYAVAQLVYNVKFKGTEIPDAQGINRAIGTNNFELTGILIGNQKPVDYKFDQIESGDEEKTIYDPTTKTPITDQTGNTKFYTLALQSKKSTTESVNFALEFVNNGDPFYGKNGLVPTGGTFYLAGTLSVANNKNTDDSEASKSNYVLWKAHQTTANISISSLQGASYTIPDLRKTQLNLGLYVDLTWKAGITNDVNIN